MVKILKRCETESHRQELIYAILGKCLSSYNAGQNKLSVRCRFKCGMSNVPDSFKEQDPDTARHASVVLRQVPHCTCRTSRDPIPEQNRSQTFSGASLREGGLFALMSGV